MERYAARRSLTGAWIETGRRASDEEVLYRRSLTGAWIETGLETQDSGTRGSLPYGGVD